MSKVHSFHIPVMGIGYTIDTPLKVAQYGIDSVISLVDDMLLERLRKMYCEKYQQPYEAITEAVEDFRAKRITAYLDLMHDLAKAKFEQIQNVTEDAQNDLKKYVDLLPNTAEVKQRFQNIRMYFLHMWAARIQGGGAGQSRFQNIRVCCRQRRA